MVIVLGSQMCRSELPDDPTISELGNHNVTLNSYENEQL